MHCSLGRGYSVNVYNPNNQVVGMAQVDPKTNRVQTTFNRYFQDYPYQEIMNLGVRYSLF